MEVHPSTIGIACILLAVLIVPTSAVSPVIPDDPDEIKSANEEIDLAVYPARGSSNGRYAGFAGDDNLSISLDGSRAARHVTTPGTDPSGQGVNPDATTVVKDVFVIENRAPDPARVWIEHPGVADGNVTFVRNASGPLMSVEGPSNCFPVPANGREHVGIRVETTDTSPASLLDTVTVRAQRSGSSLDCGEQPTGEADLGVETTFASRTVDPGGSTTLRVRVRNNGPAAATGVRVFGAVPPGLSREGLSATTGEYDESRGLWTIGSMAAGEEATLEIGVRAPEATERTPTPTQTQTETVSTLPTPTPTQTRTETATPTPTPTSTPPPEVSIGNTTVDVQELGTASITLSEAPNGISSYNLTVSLSDAGIAGIEGVSAGDAGTLHTRHHTQGRITFNTTDAQDGIGPGATDADLGGVEFIGVEQGTTTVQIEINSIEDDEQTSMTVDTSDGVLEVVPTLSASAVGSGSRGEPDTDTASSTPAVVRADTGDTTPSVQMLRSPDASAESGRPPYGAVTPPSTYAAIPPSFDYTATAAGDQPDPNSANNQDSARLDVTTPTPTPTSTTSPTSPTPTPTSTTSPSSPTPTPTSETPAEGGDGRDPTPTGPPEPPTGGTPTPTGSTEKTPTPSGADGATADFSATVGASSCTLQLAAADQPGNTDAYDFRWEIGGVSATGKRVDHRVSRPGPIPVKLAVSDVDGTTETAAREVMVNDRPSVQSLVPVAIRSGEPVRLEANATDDIGGIDRVVWKFDDGSTKVGQTITHTFEGGRQQIEVTAYDTCGATDRTAFAVEASPRGPTDVAVDAIESGLPFVVRIAIVALLAPVLFAFDRRINSRRRRRRRR